MEGGISAWEGLTAEGPPEFGMAYFDGSEKPEELVALAWILEDGSRKFYSALLSLFDDQEAQGVSGSGSSSSGPEPGPGSNHPARVP